MDPCSRLASSAGMSLILLVLLIGHVFSLQCNYYLHSGETQDTKVRTCLMQEPFYCFRILIHNASEWISYQQLGCSADQVSPQLYSDVDPESTCNTSATLNGTSVEIYCCRDDFCNALVNQPTTQPFVDTSYTCQDDRYCFASLVTGVTGLVLMVLFTIGIVAYLVVWYVHYRKLRSRYIKSVVGTVSMQEVKNCENDSSDSPQKSLASDSSIAFSLSV